MARMNGNASKNTRAIALTYMLIGVISARAADVAGHTEPKRVYHLPQEVAQELRAYNSPDQRGGCAESNIFIHGYHVLDPLRRHMWFLGAPDYLCDTSSFISVIVDSDGNWTVGKSLEEDWRGSHNLQGVPVLFKHVRNIGFFLASEWRVEGPGNLMYYSSDGVGWAPVRLPTATPKHSENGCCDAPTIRNLCVQDSGDIYLSYEDSRVFDAATWRAPIDDAFPQTVSWSRSADIPVDAVCDSHWRQDFIPSGLREKTSEGALFDSSIDWAVLIPGPTK